jgi:hypothetical protein
MKAQIIIYNAVNYLVLVVTSKWFLTYSIILLYFIRLYNSYCAENLNIVLDLVITVFFVYLYLFYFLISKNVTNFHIHMDFVILYGSTERKSMMMMMMTKFQNEYDVNNYKVQEGCW